MRRLYLDPLLFALTILEDHSAHQTSRTAPVSAITTLPTTQNPAHKTRSKTAKIREMRAQPLRLSAHGSTWAEVPGFEGEMYNVDSAKKERGYLYVTTKEKKELRGGK